MILKDYIDEHEFEFIMSYTKCALWSEELESSNLQISKEAQLRMTEDCLRFLEKAQNIIPYDKWSQAGHDFWLTRNGHGTGFWDRPEIYGEENAQKLTEISESFGNFDLIVDDETNQIDGY